MCVCDLRSIHRKCIPVPLSVLFCVLISMVPTYIVLLQLFFFLGGLIKQTSQVCGKKNVGGGNVNYVELSPEGQIQVFL